MIPHDVPEMTQKEQEIEATLLFMSNLTLRDIAKFINNANKSLIQANKNNREFAQKYHEQEQRIAELEGKEAQP